MTDKQALRKAAIAATGGKWVFSRSGVNSNVQAPIELQKGGRALVVLCKLNNAGWSGQIQTENNAKFIAAANPATVLALLDELEAKDSTISTQQQEIRKLLNALEQATEKRNSDIPGQKRLIGWRASDYTDETSDPELAKNWAAAIGVLPIFEGDVNTKLAAAGIGKGE
ncbi:TPA: ead/Ea22-like family protein [Citrobacter koseri]|nr:ead/Ea22-like family protein [Citrobacter koseri]HEM8489967.1 ead/Ea22-like family protein [Citrobacter koseri]